MLVSFTSSIMVLICVDLVTLMFSSLFFGLGLVGSAGLWNEMRELFFCLYGDFGPLLLVAGLMRELIFFSTFLLDLLIRL